jgi:hypothetical protein
VLGAGGILYARQRSAFRRYSHAHAQDGRHINSPVAPPVIKNVDGALVRDPSACKQSINATPFLKDSFKGSRLRVIVCDIHLEKGGVGAESCD